MKALTQLKISFVAVIGLVVTSVLSISAAHALLSPSSGPASGGTSVTVSGIDFVSVHTGEDFSVGLTNEGTLYSWGRNIQGQLGDGSTTNSYTPIPVKGEGGIGVLSGVTAVDVGYYHALALTTSGLYAWGDNAYGQVGDGTTTDALTPVKVQGVGGVGVLSGVTSVAAGGYHSTAVRSGNVFTWGINNLGQLGNNTTTDESTPVQVLGVGASGFLSDVRTISAGGSHNVVSTSSGVFSWGSNGFGQIGNGTTNNALVPVQVIGVGNTGFFPAPDALSAGGGFTLAQIGGNVFSWGNNTDGQLGDGSNTQRSVPVAVQNEQGNAPLSGVLSIAAAAYNAYAIVSDGVYNWGSNSAGGLCIGVLATQTPSSSLPVYILGETGSSPLPQVESISGGNRVTNILTPSGIVSCGDGYYGQFGNGSTAGSLRVVSGPRFEATGVSFGSTAGLGFANAAGTLTVTTPPGNAGVVDVIGNANVFGGSVAATPATVSWNAGTFTYEAALANTSSPDFFPAGVLAGVVLFGGVMLLMGVSRLNKK